MIIDFNAINQEAIDRFKNGNGLLHTRNFVDEKNKIMMSRLTPNANIGYHCHEQNSEIIFILSGEGHVEYDGNIEKVTTGTVHYCPMGHSHALYNDSSEHCLEYFAIVPEHH